MAKVYIAGSYSGRKRIGEEAIKLSQRGFTILSRWLDDNDFIEQAWDSNFGGRVAETMAMSDTFAIFNADLVILDTIDKSSTGGSDTELGIALTRELDRKVHIVHIGPYRNIFQTLVKEHYPTWNAFFTVYDARIQ